MKDINVDKYLDHQTSPQKEICIRLRKIIFKTFPDIKEEMKWGVPAYAKGRYYFVALKNHVNLGFSIKGLSKDEISLFQGHGKTTRVIEIKSEQEIDEAQSVQLLKITQNK